MSLFIVRGLVWPLLEELDLIAFCCSEGPRGLGGGVYGIGWLPGFVV